VPSPIAFGFGFIVAATSALCAESRVQPDASADALVEQLRELPTPLSSTTSPSLPPEKQKRHQIFEQLHDLGRESVPALARALRDPDVNMRRNATLALGALGGGWWQFATGSAKIDTRAALPALISALQDKDQDVRAWSAQAIGDIGPAAVTAVPSLVKLLSNDAYSRISVFIALYGIGPAAKAALPALKPYLSDPDADVRRMAARAVAGIQGIAE
jgi:HEAT repeat protein